MGAIVWVDTASRHANVERFCNVALATAYEWFFERHAFKIGWRVSKELDTLLIFTSEDLCFSSLHQDIE